MNRPLQKLTLHVKRNLNAYSERFRTFDNNFNRWIFVLYDRSRALNACILRHHATSLITTFIVVTLLIVPLNIVATSSRKISHPGISLRAFNRKSTIVSGFGSNKQTIAENATKFIEPSTRPNNMRIQKPLHIMQIPIAGSIFLYSSTKNETISIAITNNEIVNTTRQSRLLPSMRQLNITKIDPVHNLSSAQHLNNWIPIEGLFGVYRLPSGFLFVWILDSQSVYNAPPISIPKKKRLLRVNWWRLYRIKKFHLTHIPLVQEVQKNVTNQTHENTLLLRRHRLEERRQLRLLRQALKDHEWYFSRSRFGFIPDISRNMQGSILNGWPKRFNATTHNGFSKEVFDAPMNGCRQPESHFFWNEAIIEPLILLRSFGDNQSSSACKTLLHHVIPVTSAFCGIQPNLSVYDNDNETSTSLRYDQILFSRRSRFRAGTRFTRRGSDSTGAVANQAETEQILILWNNTSLKDTRRKQTCAVLSHVQTRGSIPLRWSSPTDIKSYRPRVRIGTNPLSQARALRNHLVDHAKRYILPSPSVMDSGLAGKYHRNDSTHPNLLFVNLVDKKSDQGRLGRAFEATLKALLAVYNSKTETGMSWLDGSLVKHLWFDFHAEVKSGKWNNLVGLLERVKLSLIGQNYFLAIPTNASPAMPFRIDRLQTGVIRTNCMDCLDRTNVVQSIFGRFMLFQQLADLKMIDLPEVYKAKFNRQPLELPWSRGEVAHRLLWADNADEISRLYAGTPALKGDFTRTGHRTKMGVIEDGLNSLHRYYLNNFRDLERQEGIDLLTGSEVFSNVDDGAAVSFATGMTAVDSPRQAISDELAIYMIIHDDHRRQKVRSLEGSIKSGMPFHKVVELPSDIRPRWLQGDLKLQLRHPVASSDNYAHIYSKSNECLQPMVTISKSDSPWWIALDSSSGVDPKKCSLFVGPSVLETSKNIEYLVLAIVVGTQISFTLASIIVMLGAFLFIFVYEPAN